MSRRRALNYSTPPTLVDNQDLWLAKLSVAKITALRDQKRHELDQAEQALDEAYAQLKKVHGVG